MPGDTFTCTHCKEVKDRADFNKMQLYNSGKGRCYACAKMFRPGAEFGSTKKSPTKARS
jgi:NAD-dependent SIR2 family protein deacetylase